MEKVILHGIAEQEESVRTFLKREWDISERLLRKLKLNKRISCNGEEIWINSLVKPGDVICADISFEEGNEDILAEKVRNLGQT